MRISKSMKKGNLVSLLNTTLHASIAFICIIFTAIWSLSEN